MFIADITSIIANLSRLVWSELPHRAVKWYVSALKTSISLKKFLPSDPKRSLITVITLSFVSSSSNLLVVSTHSTLTVRTISGVVRILDLRNPSTWSIKPSDDTVVITTIKSLSGDSNTDKRTGTIWARTTGFNW